MDDSGKNESQYLSAAKNREVLDNRRRRPAWIRILLILAVVGALALLYLNGSHGYLAILDLQKENEEAVDTIAQLEKENEELVQLIEQDGEYTDEQYIRIAREILGWVMPGERVYRFVEDDSDDEEDGEQ